MNKKLRLIVKKFTVFALCMAVMCAFASCSNVPSATTTGTTATTSVPVKVEPTKYTYEEYLDGVLDGGYIAFLHKDEAKYIEKAMAAAKEARANRFVDEAKVGNTMEIEINGDTYTFTYKETLKSNSYNVELKDLYMYEYDTGYELRMTYNPTIERVSSVYRILNEGEKIMTRDTAFEKAKDILKEHLQTHEEYELEYENDRRGDSYFFTFRRIVDGFRVEEKANIEINYDGTICAYQFIGMNAFDGVDLTGVSMDKINGIIKEKCEKVYEGYTYEMKETELLVSRKADGSFVISCTAHAEVEGGELPKKMKDRTCLFIYLE
jgi:hypothetical protein